MNASGGGNLSVADYDAVRSFELFADFTDDELRRLLRGASIKTPARGTVLFLQGDEADKFFLVLSGRVKLVKTSEDGSEGIIELFTAGQSFGEAAMFTSRRFPVGAVLLTDSRLVRIAAAPFLDELSKSSDLLFKVLANLARLHRRLIRQLGDLRLKSPGQRLGSYLLSLTRVTEGRAEVRLPEDKGIIAGRIGISSESLSRALVRLRENGVQCQGRNVVMDDVLGLREFCAQELYVADSPCGSIGYCAAVAERQDQCKM